MVALTNLVMRRARRSGVRSTISRSESKVSTVGWVATMSVFFFLNLELISSGSYLPFDNFSISDLVFKPLDATLILCFKSVFDILWRLMGIPGRNSANFLGGMQGAAKSTLKIMTAKTGYINPTTID